MHNWITGVKARKIEMLVHWLPSYGIGNGIDITDSTQKQNKPLVKFVDSN